MTATIGISSKGVPDLASIEKHFRLLSEQEGIGKIVFCSTPDNVEAAKKILGDDVEYKIRHDFADPHEWLVITRIDDAAKGEALMKEIVKKEENDEK